MKNALRILRDFSTARTYLTDWPKQYAHETLVSLFFQCEWGKQRRSPFLQINTILQAETTLIGLPKLEPSSCWSATRHQGTDLVWYGIISFPRVIQIARVSRPTLPVFEAIFPRSVVHRLVLRTKQTQYQVTQSLISTCIITLLFAPSWPSCFTQSCGSSAEPTFPRLMVYLSCPLFPSLAAFSCWVNITLATAPSWSIHTETSSR